MKCQNPSFLEAITRCEFTCGCSLIHVPFPLQILQRQKTTCLWVAIKSSPSPMFQGVRVTGSPANKGWVTFPSLGHPLSLEQLSGCFWKGGQSVPANFKAIRKECQKLLGSSEWVKWRHDLRGGGNLQSWGKSPRTGLAREDSSQGKILPFMLVTLRGEMDGSKTQRRK